MEMLRFQCKWVFSPLFRSPSILSSFALRFALWIAIHTHCLPQTYTHSEMDVQSHARGSAFVLKRVHHVSGGNETLGSFLYWK